MADGILCPIHMGDGEVAQASGTDGKSTHTNLKPEVVGDSAELGNDECCMMVITIAFFRLSFPFSYALVKPSTNYALTEANHSESLL